MHTFEEIQKIVKQEISGLNFIKEPVELYQPIKYTLDSGGKRIRPTLVLMGCNLFSESVDEALLPAMAVEIFHNFTLLHDDIMDKSEMRRGKPTVHVNWNQNVAILSGDAMSIKSYELLAEYKGYNFSDIFKLFNTTALQICEGQQLDMNFEERDFVTEEEYLRMIELKTAVLLACSLKIGALAGGADEEDAQNLYEFGRYLGLSFQLQDDFLDLYGDPEIFGKKIGGDIVANKKTYLMIKAIEVAENEDRKRLLDLIGESSIHPDEKISQVKSIFNKYEINTHTSEKIKEYYTMAKGYLDKIKVNDDRKQPIRDIADQLMKRNK